MEISLAVQDIFPNYTYKLHEQISIIGDGVLFTAPISSRICSLYSLFSITETVIFEMWTLWNGAAEIHVGRDVSKLDIPAGTTSRRSSDSAIKSRKSLLGPGRKCLRVIHLTREVVNVNVLLLFIYFIYFSIFRQGHLISNS